MCCRNLERGLSFFLFKFMRIKGRTNVSIGKLITGQKGGREPSSGKQAWQRHLFVCKKKFSQKEDVFVCVCVCIDHSRCLFIPDCAFFFPFDILLKGAVLYQMYHLCVFVYWAHTVR